MRKLPFDSLDDSIPLVLSERPKVLYRLWGELDFKH